MSLLHLPLMLTDRQQTTVKAMAEFNALIYGSYFLQSPLAYAAVHQIQNPAGQELKIAQAAKKSVCRHLWYLTQELVVLALFDKKLPECERYEMSCKLLETTLSPVQDIGKPAFPQGAPLDNVMSCGDIFIAQSI